MGGGGGEGLIVLKVGCRMSIPISAWVGRGVEGGGLNEHMMGRVRREKT